MTTSTTTDNFERVPIGELATLPNPADWHAALRSRGTHVRGGQWTVSTPSDVAAALAAAALHVVPPEAGAGPAADLIARMARFCDGDQHRRRRATTVRLLPAVAGIAAQAARGATQYLRAHAAAEVLDVMPLARTLPAEAIAGGLGMAPADAAAAADQAGRLCDALASGRTSAADAAACGLCAALRPLGLSGEDEVAAAASILFQARDATAALIGATVLASGHGQSAPTAVLVDSVLRRQAPVQCTRRAAAADTTIGGVVVPRGSELWIFLAAAELGNGRPAAFGSGPHACPGADQAGAIAREVVTALDAGGWRPVPGQRVDYEPRPNLRLPREVLVSRG